VQCRRLLISPSFIFTPPCAQGKRPTTRKSLGEKEQEYLDALRVGVLSRRQVVARDGLDLDRLQETPNHQPLLTAMTCLQAFYYDGKPTMSDEEFENLEQELLWEGSRVAILRCTTSRMLLVTCK
jgi:hypothetical protein